MSITRRESFVVHFFYDESGYVVARVTDPMTHDAWHVALAMQLRALIASGAPLRTHPDEE